MTEITIANGVKVKPGDTVYVARDDFPARIVREQKGDGFIDMTYGEKRTAIAHPCFVFRTRDEAIDYVLRKNANELESLRVQVFAHEMLISKLEAMKERA